MFNRQALDEPAWTLTPQKGPSKSSGVIACKTSTVFVVRRDSSIGWKRGLARIDASQTETMVKKFGLGVVVLGFLLEVGGCAPSEPNGGGSENGTGAAPSILDDGGSSGGSDAVGSTTGGSTASGGAASGGSGGGEPVVVLTPEGLESGGIYEIRARSTGRLLNVSHSSLSDGANVDTWTDTDSDAMRWVVTSLGQAAYTLTNVGTDKLLHVAGDAAQEANVDQVGAVDDDSVRWLITDEGDGSHSLRPAANEALRLDLDGGGDSDGANVWLWEDNGSDPQRWIFQRVEGQDVAPTIALANTAMASWKAKYYVLDENGGHIANEGFWGVAEMMEMVLDAYEVTGDVQYRTMFEELYEGFLHDEGTDWLWNDFNDDIMWITIASVRGYLLFGHDDYLDKAVYHFERTTERALTDLYGGGMIWKQGLTSKNSCINGPTMVAACYLAQATSNDAYIATAEEIYAWERAHLFDEDTGAVWDSYNGPDDINYWSSTYNQGTILGSALMLYAATGTQMYRDDAIKIAEYTRHQMYGDDTINWESGQDLEGFKGIFPRYARRYVLDLDMHDYVPWFEENARVAYNNRNSSGIISTLWGTRTPEDAELKAFDAYTGVSILFNALIEN